ncbi:MAG TPA: PaaI family thioesterase, partial [Terriglobales bacterium]|nr:PaaI family thioesterase [Terriglobales bacterium]
KIAVTMSGMELLQAIIAGKLPAPAIARTLNYRLTEISPGHAVFTGTPTTDHYNPLSTVHGGYIATLLDSAMGCSVHSKLVAGQSYTTLEFKVNFVRPVLATTGEVRAEGTLIHLGKRSATSEGRLLDASGKLYAHATTTCLIFG